MRRESVHVRGAALALYHLGAASPRDAPQLIWAHGWGHTHRNLLALASALVPRTDSTLLDFPGFGASPPPPTAWGTADYADAVAEWLAGLPPRPRIWASHSFGARVGLQLAARHPELVDGMLLVAAAGLPPRRSVAAQARIVVRRWTFRLVRLFVPEGLARDRLRRRFGSADYRQAGALRPILVKVVNEDLTEVARAVRCPTVLVYGDQDRETPPEMGARFAAMIPQSRLVLLRGFDHWNVLTEGQHQIVQRLGELIDRIGRREG